MRRQDALDRGEHRQLAVGEEALRERGGRPAEPERVFQQAEQRDRANHEDEDRDGRSGEMVHRISPLKRTARPVDGDRAGPPVTTRRAGPRRCPSARGGRGWNAGPPAPRRRRCRGCGRPARPRCCAWRSPRPPWRCRTCQPRRSPISLSSTTMVSSSRTRVTPTLNSRWLERLRSWLDMTVIALSVVMPCRRPVVADLDGLAIAVVAHEGGIARTSCVDGGVLRPVAMFAQHLDHVCFGGEPVRMIGDDGVEGERLVDRSDRHDRLRLERRKGSAARHGEWQAPACRDASEPCDRG